MDCENCKHINSENDSYCEECGFPILNDNYERIKYRVKVKEVENKIREFKTIRKSILTFSIYALIGALIVFIYNLIRRSSNYHSTIFFLTISVIYFFIYKFEKNFKDNLLFILTVLSFYIFHTYFEYINQIDPRKLLSAYSFTKTGHFHFIPLLADTFHYIYYIIRIVIILYFIKAIWIIYYFNRNRQIYKYLNKNYAR